MYRIRIANGSDRDKIVKFIDSTFTKEGYGFVSNAQIGSEIKRESVYVAESEGAVIGVRVGLKRVYNLVVHPDWRQHGIGSRLIGIYPPDIIRVKSIPVGNMSKKQKANFKNPEGFYKKLGYHLEKMDYARNFWQRGKSGESAHYHKEGGKKHIKIYSNAKKVQIDFEAETLYGLDEIEERVNE